ncbi:MAG: NADPH-dependent oxidoreductase, partial [Rhodococcus sp. (in: high G+C Gram-positive bacteria)]
YVAFGLAVGKPDPDRAGSMRPRPSQDVVLHHNRYDASRSEGWLEGYEEAFKDFRSTARLSKRSWAESVQVGTGLPYMDGRENLRKTVEDRGYLLG